MPAIVITFYPFSLSYFSGTFLPVIPHLRLSPDNWSDAFLPSESFIYDFSFLYNPDKRYFLRGTAMQYHSHIEVGFLTVPLDCTSFFFLSLTYLVFLTRFACSFVYACILPDHFYFVNTFL